MTISVMVLLIYVINRQLYNSFKVKQSREKIQIMTLC